MAKLRTLADVKNAGLNMVAVCHNMSCRHTKDVDLHALIKAIGEMASLLPVKGSPHFSERMRCPECGHRGMFLWIDAPKAPSPISNSALNFRVVAYDRMTGTAMTDVLRAADREVAQAGIEVAEAIYPKHRLEMTWHNRIIYQSHMKIVKGGRG